MAFGKSRDADAKSSLVGVTGEFFDEANQINGLRESIAGGVVVGLVARRVAAEVALDAIDSLTGKQTSFAGVLAGTRSMQLPDPNFGNYFLTVFGRPNGDSACECERGTEANLAQSLHLINSADILAKLGGSRATALAADKARDVAAKIEELYLVALSRPPAAAETADVKAYLAAHADNAAAAWEDVIWSLLNTKEFLFTH